MRTARSFFAFAALVVLAACRLPPDCPPHHGGSTGPTGPTGPTLGQPTDLVGFLSFQQVVPVSDPDRLRPGVANVWDLQPDLSLADGGDDQFDGALALRVGTLPTRPPTWDSVLAELDGLDAFGPVDLPGGIRFYTPLVKDGLVAAAADPFLPARGAASARLLPWVSGRLSQTVDLGDAAGAVQLSLLRYYELSTHFPGLDATAWRVRLLDPATGAVLRTVEEATGNAGSAVGVLTADLSDLAGRQVQLAIENRSERDAFVDDVSIRDGGGAGAERVRNGDFETGDLSGWTASVLSSQPSGLATAAPQPLAGLAVTRAFHATPTSPWGRWVDTFHNSGAAELTRDVAYDINLGSDGCAIVSDTPGAAGAITAWDATGGDRDVALVAGSGHRAGSILYRSATSLDGCEGDERVFVVHRITVPAGGTVSLAHYVVMTGVDTGSLATTADVAARATLADEQARDIVEHYGTQAAFRDGMTEEELDSVGNF